MLYKVINAYVIKVQHKCFSSLPYSAFRTTLLAKPENVQNLKMSSQQFKYRGGVMALRAPKHFKAGKQFYSVPKRIVVITCKNISKNLANENVKNLEIMQLYQTARNLSKMYTMSSPLSVEKSKTLKIRFLLKVKKIL